VEARAKGKRECIARLILVLVLVLVLIIRQRHLLSWQSETQFNEQRSCDTYDARI